MNFWNRFGWSLLLFGVVALAASFFGYAPRKLAHLGPGQIKGAAVAFMALGAFALVLGGDPRTRRKLLIGLGWATGIAVAVLAVMLFIGYRASKRTMEPPPAPNPASSWTAPVSAPGAPPEAAGMTVFYQKRRELESRFGRGPVWAVVVHLGGGEPPADFEARLRALVAGKDGGDVAVGRTGGVLHASLAPNEDPGALRNVLEGLFPGAQVQVTDRARQATVFARGPAAPR